MILPGPHGGRQMFLCRTLMDGYFRIGPLLFSFLWSIYIGGDESQFPPCSFPTVHDRGPFTFSRHGAVLSSTTSERFCALDTCFR
jgi:hypothetical protein